MIKKIYLRDQDEILLALGVQDRKLRALEKEFKIDASVKYNEDGQGAELALKGTHSRLDKALARLKKGEPIDRLLYGGYSSISLGYAGLYECVKYMTGKSHTDPEATPFALEVMQHMNDACDKWKEETNIAFSIYGSPIESTTYKFAKCLQKRFGIVPGVTDKSYITNSYHVHVGEEIDAFSKLKFESQFQALSTGGAISYVEVPDMQDNIPAVLQVIRFIYDNIMYAEKYQERLLSGMRI